VSYAASMAAFWVGQANDRTGTVLAAGAQRATPGWVSGQRWSASAAQWGVAAWDPGNAANSYSDAAARLWSATSGLWKGAARDTFGTVAGQATPGWVNGQLWSTTAAQWEGQWNTANTNYNNEVTAYNNQVAAYNALLNGLNSPDGLQSQGFSISHVGGGTEVQIGTFTFGRAGHFLVAVVCSVNGPNVTQNNATSDLRLAGVIVNTTHANIGAAGGARNWWHAYAQDVDVAAGATLSLFFNCFVTGNPTTGTATVYAHFVPNAANHN
jgi:hypothetical protein